MAGALEHRIGTAERERVRDLLERHTAEGRLSLDEFGERIDEVLRARTAADLDHTLRELPPPQVTRPQPPRWRPVPTFAVIALPVLAVLLVVNLVAGLGDGNFVPFPFFPFLFLFLFLRGGARRRGWRLDRDEDSRTRWV